MRILVALAFAKRQAVVAVELAEGATVADAVAAARLQAHFPDVEPRRLAPGVWSKACAWETPLRDGDRVELYRALGADAKQMRRARARRGRR